MKIGMRQFNTKGETKQKPRKKKNRNRENKQKEY
jgi:hypothetical protein